MSLTVTLRPDEQAVLDDIRRAGGFRTDEDAVKCALWNFARFLDLDVAPDVFAVAVSAVVQARINGEQAERDGDQGDLFAEAVS